MRNARKKKKITKRNCEVNRFSERFKYDMNVEEYNKIVRNLKDNKYKHIGNGSLRIRYFVGDVMGNSTIMVYDKNREAIVTFLKKEMKI